MPKRFDYTTDLPEVGDVVRYSRSGHETLVLPVTHREGQGGYTDYWLGYQLGKTSPNFNINHTTGHANTYHNQCGRWEIVRRAEDPKPLSLYDFGDTVTPEEQAFGADLYDLLTKHDFPFLNGKFFGRGRVIQATIEAVRKEGAK
jgi:hypothetical protein